MLAAIAAVVSYSHMYELAQRYGEPPWRAALFPLSVDGMIVASSMALLADARRGRRGGVLPWTLLILGSVASLSANIAVADPTLWSGVIHAWPSFALMGAYELLMRMLRLTANGAVRPVPAGNEQSVRTGGEGSAAKPEGPHGDDDVVARRSEGQDRPRLRVVEAADRKTTAAGEQIADDSYAVLAAQVEAWR